MDWEVVWRGDSWREIPPPDDLDYRVQNVASVLRKPRLSVETWDDKILGCLSSASDPLTAAQIALRINRAPKMVRMFLGQLKKRKVVTSRPKVETRESAGRPTHVWWML